MSPILSILDRASLPGACAEDYRALVHDRLAPVLLGSYELARAVLIRAWDTCPERISAAVEAWQRECERIDRDMAAPIVLPEEDFDRLTAAIEHPDPPTAELVDLMAPTRKDTP